MQCWLAVSETEPVTETDPEVRKFNMLKKQVKFVKRRFTVDVDSDAQGTS